MHRWVTLGCCVGFFRSALAAVPTTLARSTVVQLEGLYVNCSSYSNISSCFAGANDAFCFLTAGNSHNATITGLSQNLVSTCNATLGTTYFVVAKEPSTFGRCQEFAEMPISCTALTYPPPAPPLLSPPPEPPLVEGFSPPASPPPMGAWESVDIGEVIVFDIPFATYALNNVSYNAAFKSAVAKILGISTQTLNVESISPSGLGTKLVVNFLVSPTTTTTSSDYAVQHTHKIVSNLFCELCSSDANCAPNAGQQACNDFLAAISLNGLRGTAYYKSLPSNLGPTALSPPAKVNNSEIGTWNIVGGYAIALDMDYTAFALHEQTYTAAFEAGLADSLGVLPTQVEVTTFEPSSQNTVTVHFTTLLTSDTSYAFDFYVSIENLFTPGCPNAGCEAGYCSPLVQNFVRYGLPVTNAYHLDQVKPTPYLPITTCPPFSVVGNVKITSPKVRRTLLQALSPFPPRPPPKPSPPSPPPPSPPLPSCSTANSARKDACIIAFRTSIAQSLNAVTQNIMILPGDISITKISNIPKGVNVQFSITSIFPSGVVAAVAQLPQVGALVLTQNLQANFALQNVSFCDTQALCYLQATVLAQTTVAPIYTMPSPPPPASVDTPVTSTTTTTTTSGTSSSSSSSTSSTSSTTTSTSTTTSADTGLG